MRNAKRSIDVTDTRVIDPEVGERRRWMMMMGASIGLSAVVSHQSREARPRLKYTTGILSICIAHTSIEAPFTSPYLFKETDIRAKFDVQGSSPALYICCTSHRWITAPMACRYHGYMAVRI
jgi:hypothetical protein